MEHAPSYGLATTVSELEAVCDRVSRSRTPYGFDIETGYEGETRPKAQLHPEENLIAGFSLAGDLTWARYVPLAHDSGCNADEHRAAELLWPLLHLTDPQGLPLGVAHGAIFELRCLSRWFLRLLGDHPEYGTQVRAARGYFPLRSDTLIESYVEAEQPSHGLKDITWRTFGHRMTEIMELFPDGLTKREQDSIRFNVLDQHDPKVHAYACEDALWCLAHHKRRFPALRDHPVYGLEMALLREVLPFMADAGVFYDWNLISDARRRAHEFLPLFEAEVRAAFAEATGKPCTISFSSPRQLATLLYEDLGLPVIKRTKTGAPSTNAKEVLVNYKDSPPVAKFLQWKELQSLCSSFLDAYEDKYGWAPDGMTHPQFLQHGTISGRGAHADPNYAQTSKKKYDLALADGTRFTFQLRRAIAAPPGWYMLGFDYSMIELRVVAGEAQETNLLDAFEAGVDVHRKTAALMLGCGEDQVGKDERQTGKTANFSLGYGQSAKALSERLGVTLERAEELYGIYHASYPRLNRRRNEVIAQARRDGYVITKFGRKVPLPDLFSANRRLREDAERAAGNVYVQGPGSGDYPKIAMVRATRALRAAGLDDDVKLVMNIHDALEFYVRDGIPPARVLRVLAPAVVFPVPGWPTIVADWHIGRNWADLQDLDVAADGTVRLKDSAPANTAPGNTAPASTAPPGTAPASTAPPARSGQDPAPAKETPRDPDCRPGPAPDVPGRLHGPGTGPAAPAAAGDGGAPPPGTGRTVVAETTVMPPPAAVTALAALARSAPGDSTLVLRTPAGDAPLPGTTGLAPDRGPEVSVVLGGARVYYDAASVDPAALTAGLAL